MKKNIFFIVYCLTHAPLIHPSSWFNFSKKKPVEAPRKSSASHDSETRDIESPTSPLIEPPASPITTMSRMLTQMPPPTCQQLYMLERGVRTVKDDFNVNANANSGYVFKYIFKEHKGNILCNVHILPDGKNENILATIRVVAATNALPDFFNKALQVPKEENRYALQQTTHDTYNACTMSLYKKFFNDKKVTTHACTEIEKQPVIIKGDPAQKSGFIPDTLLVKIPLIKEFAAMAEHFRPKEEIIKNIFDDDEKSTQK